MTLLNLQILLLVILVFTQPKEDAVAAMILSANSTNTITEGKTSAATPVNATAISLNASGNLTESETTSSQNTSPTSITVAELTTSKRSRYTC
ncbi:unnamed protein product [Dicrocoelium dendriticum]|nr:unnamed protein product [Dicrocoelium dendriticum]